MHDLLAAEAGVTGGVTSSAHAVDEVINYVAAMRRGLDQSEQSRFERAGILVEITGNARNRRFRYEPYVALFRE